MTLKASEGLIGTEMEVEQRWKRILAHVSLKQLLTQIEHVRLFKKGGIE